MMAMVTGLNRNMLIITLVLACLSCGSKTAQEHLESAHGSIAAGEPQVAIIELKNAIQKEPSLGEARSLLGQIRYQGGDLQAALRELQRAIDLDVTDDATRLTLLRTKNALGRFSEVVGELEGQGPLSPEFGVVLANAYLLAGDVERAKPLLQKGRDLPEGRFGMARVAQLENDMDGALQHLEALTETHPDNRAAWLFKGEVELFQGKSQAALVSFAKARGLAGGETGGRLGMIRAHILADDLDAADQEADSLIAIDKEFLPVQYLKGLISFKKNDMEAAEAALRVVQRFNSDHLPSLHLMGAVNTRQGKYDQAAKNLTRYLGKDKYNVPVRKLLASIYNEQGNFEAAVETLEPVSSQSSDAQLWAMLGAAQLRLGDAATATASYREAVSLAPDMAPYRNQLALSLISSGADDEALAQLGSAIELDSDQFQSDYILVMVKLREGDYAGALLAAEQLIDKSDGLPIGHNLKGTIALAKGDEAAAQAAFEQAVAVDPNYFPAVQSLAYLAENAGDVERAKALYGNLLESEAGNERASLALIGLTARQGDIVKASTMYAEAGSRYPQSVDVRLGHMRLLLSDGRLQESARVADEAYALAPANVDVLILKAETQYRLGNKSAANSVAVEMQGLVDKLDNDARALGYAGALQLRLGNLSAARSNLQAAIAGAGSDTNALLNLTRLELAEGNVSAASKRLDQLLARGASGEDVELLQGELLMARDQKAAARRTFASMVAGGSRRAAMRYSALSAEQGDYSEAQRILIEWLEENPRDRGAQMLLANAQIGSGAPDDAKAQYEAMLPTDNPVVLNNLAWIYMGEGNPRALEMARQALASSPGNPDIEDTLGWILVNQGELSEGLELLRSSAKALPDNPSVQYHLGVAYAESGDAELARRALQGALRMGDFGEVEEARKALADL